ncbi:MAG UNVERIFIED_CONTAM: hypothetical protein LVR29_18125 [Microcystis novacekii LVE1205-3]|jgi:magnesium chelatase family protein
MLARVWSAAIIGIDAIKIGVEVDVSGDYPNCRGGFTRYCRAGVKRKGKSFPKKCWICLSHSQNCHQFKSSQYPQRGPIYDLPISIGILGASEQVEADLLGDFLFLGELSLDGSLRAVAGVLPIAACRRKMGIKGLVVPADNAKEAGRG